MHYTISRGIINGVCFGADGNNIYCALACSVLVQTPLVRLGSLRDYCIEALREAESMEQTGYVYKAKGGSRPTEQAGPAIPCDIIKSCG